MGSFPDPNYGGSMKISENINENNVKYRQRIDGLCDVEFQTD